MKPVLYTPAQVQVKKTRKEWEKFFGDAAQIITARRDGSIVIETVGGANHQKVLALFEANHMTARGNYSFRTGGYDWTIYQMNELSEAETRWNARVEELSEGRQREHLSVVTRHSLESFIRDSMTFPKVRITDDEYVEVVGGIDEEYVLIETDSRSVSLAGHCWSKRNMEIATWRGEVCAIERGNETGQCRALEYRDGEYSITSYDANDLVIITFADTLWHTFGYGQMIAELNVMNGRTIRISTDIPDEELSQTDVKISWYCTVTNLDEAQKFTEVMQEAFTIAKAFERLHQRMTE